MFVWSARGVLVEYEVDRSRVKMKMKEEEVSSSLGSVFVPLGGCAVG